MKTMKEYWLSLAILALTVALLPAHAAETSRRVTFVHSYSKATSCHEDLNRGLADGLEAGGIRASINVEYLGVGVGDWHVHKDMMEEICREARANGSEAIVAVSGVAVNALLACDDPLLRELPVVCAGMKMIPDGLRQRPNVCGFTASNDYAALMAEAVRVFPGRKEFICIADTSAYSRQCLKELNAYWETFRREHPGYSWKVYDLLAEMPARVVKDICYTKDASSHIVIAPNWTQFMSFVAANSFAAPIYAFQNLAVSSGSLCAYDMKPYDMGYQAGLMAARVLKGADPASLGFTDRKGTFLYNLKAVQQFGLSLNVVEEHGDIFGATWAELHQGWLIAGSIVLLLVVVSIIVWLLHLNQLESRRRKEMQTRLMVQEQLVKQRNEFNHIFCSFRDGLVTYGTDMELHFINPAMLRMLALPTDENYEGRQAGTYLRILCNGEDILHKLITWVREEKTPRHIPEKSFVQEIKTGSYFPVSGEIIPLLNDDKVNGIAILCHNISDEERQRLLLHMTMEDSDIFNWQYDMDKDTFYFPPRLLHYMGYPGHDGILTRAELRAMIHPDDVPAAVADFAQVRQGTNHNKRSPLRLRHSDGTYEWWEFSSVAFDGLQDGSPYMVLGISQSVQYFKDTEAQLIAARDRALQADRIKSAFIANMTHEIRTPLNAIVGFSSLLDDIEPYSPEEIREFSRLIHKNTQLLLKLVGDVLDISNLDSGSVELHPTDGRVGDLLQNVYDQQNQEERQEGVEMRLELPADDALSIHTDQARLRQILVNLVNNARKFTSHGHITLGCREDETDALTFYVEDTGKGIPEAALPYIYDRFYKVDEFIQGAGLGLCLVQILTKLLQGELSVTSKEGEGTRFEVKLPKGMRE